eukprot:1158398-Pelagomonas_calceolata.AAC.7
MADPRVDGATPVRMGQVMWCHMQFCCPVLLVSGPRWLQGQTQGLSHGLGLWLIKSICCLSQLSLRQGSLQLEMEMPSLTLLTLGPLFPCHYNTLTSVHHLCLHHLHLSLHHLFHHVISTTSLPCITCMSPCICPCIIFPVSQPHFPAPSTIRRTPPTARP